MVIDVILNLYVFFFDFLVTAKNFFFFQSPLMSARVAGAVAQD